MLAGNRLAYYSAAGVKQWDTYTSLNYGYDVAMDSSGRAVVHLDPPRPAVSLARTATWLSVPKASPFANVKTLAPTCSQPPARARALLAMAQWRSGRSTRGHGVRHR